MASQSRLTENTMTIDDTDTNPTADTETVTASEEVTELDADNEGDSEGLEGEQTAEELEEIEREGKKARIPAWLKPELMMQADYTKKTQEVAETRKQYEARQAQLAQREQAFHAEAQEYAKLIALDSAIKQYEAQIAQLRQQGQHDVAQRHWMDLMEMRNAAGQLTQGLTQKQQARAAESEREHANRIQERDAALARDIPGFAPALMSKIQDYAITDGYTPQEAQSLVDPRYVKTLNKARLWDEHQAKAKAAAAKAKQQEQPEAKPTNVVTARKPASNRLSDDMPMDKWVEIRNRQVHGR
jgi:hypothetical protein